MPPISGKMNALQQDWLVKISKDDFESIAKDIQNFVKKKENQAFACKCLLTCSKLAFNEKCSSPDALFTVTKACCDAIVLDTTDQQKLINALYHITKYLLVENLLEEAMLISENVIKVWKTKANGWSSSEENTVMAFLHSFSKHLMNINITQDLDTLVSLKNKASALNLWSHVLTLCLSLNRKPLADMLVILVNLAIKFHNLEKEKTSAFLLACLQSLLTLSENISAEKIKLDELVLSRILQVYRRIVINYMSIENGSKLRESVLSVLDKLKKVFVCGAEQVSYIQFCEKIVQFVNRSMLDLSLDAKLLKDCQTMMNKWSNESKLSYDSSYFMNGILLKVGSSWTKREPKLPGALFSPLIKLVLKSHMFLDGNRMEICSEKCAMNCDESTILQSKCLPLNWLMIFYNQNPDKNETSIKFWTSIYKDLETLLAETQDFILKLSEANCPRLSKLFQYALPYFLNGISGFARSAQYQSAYTLTVSMLQNFVKLPSIFLEENFTGKLFVKALSLINCCCYNLGQYATPLSIISAWALILPSQRKTLFRLWTNFKLDVFRSKEKKLEASVWHVLTFNASSIKKLWNAPDLSPECAGSLLIEEMKAYCKHNLPYCEPFFAVFEACRKLKLSPHQEAIILCLLVRALAHDVSSIKKLAPILDKVKEIETQLCGLKKKSETKEKLKINILLGCLIVARSCCLILKIRSQNEGELNSQCMVVEQPKSDEPGTEVNPNDSCAVTPSLSFMKIDSHQQLFDLLDEGVKYLSTAASTKVLESISFDSCLYFDSLVDAAHIYKIYGYEISEYTTWELGFKVCSTLKQNEGTIISMANILGLRSTVSAKWLAYTETLVQALDENETALKYQYFLACIRNNFLKQEYDTVNDLFQRVDTKELKKAHKLLYAEYYILLSKCFFNPDISPINCAVEAYICLAAHVKKKDWSNFTESCKLNSLLFEATLNIGDNFLDLMLPRETRSCLKAQLRLAQKLALPLRLAQVLVQLTWVDIMCCNKNDAKLKIQTLEEILLLPMRVSNLVPVKTGSRRTKLIKVEQPDFLKHENCQCFVCASSLCQHVILETIRLQAAFTNLNPEFRNYCMDFLKCAQNMLSKICRNRKEEWMQLSEIKLFIQYIDYLTLIKSFKEATKICEKISVFVSSFPDAHPCNKILKQDMFEQMVSLNRAETEQLKTV
nr:PREDICTED: uncharacterized protein LOC109031132 [Bemisia tabaci]